MRRAAVNISAVFECGCGCTRATIAGRIELLHRAGEHVFEEVVAYSRDRGIERVMIRPWCVLSFHCTVAIAGQ